MQLLETLEAEILLAVLAECPGLLAAAERTHGARCCLSRCVLSARSTCMQQLETGFAVRRYTLIAEQRTLGQTAIATRKLEMIKLRGKRNICRIPFQFANVGFPPSRNPVYSVLFEHFHETLSEGMFCSKNLILIVLEVHQIRF